MILFCYNQYQFIKTIRFKIEKHLEQSRAETFLIFVCSIFFVWKIYHSRWSKRTLWLLIDIYSLSLSLFLSLFSSICWPFQSKMVVLIECDVLQGNSNFSEFFSTLLPPVSVVIYAIVPLNIKALHWIVPQRLLNQPQS